MSKFTTLEERFSIIRFCKLKAPDGRTVFSAGVFDRDLNDFVIVKFPDRQILDFLFADCSSKDNPTFDMIINDMKGGEN